MLNGWWGGFRRKARVLDRKAMAEGRPILQGHNSHPQLRLRGRGALSTSPDIALGIGVFSC
jgi:hypothetical protein